MPALVVDSVRVRRTQNILNTLANAELTEDQRDWILPQERPEVTQASRCISIGQTDRIYFQMGFCCKTLPDSSRCESRFVTAHSSCNAERCSNVNVQSNFLAGMSRPWM